MSSGTIDPVRVSRDIVDEVSVPISAMTSGQVQDLYIRYIAAGAVATGGIISLMRSLPTIIGAFKSSLGSFGGGKTTLEGDKGVPLDPA
jgi:hypothetical protein